MKDFLKSFLALTAKPVLSRIHKYKDSHKGETCYLIGGGISLKWFDLKEFSKYQSIPCQYIPFHNDFHALDVEHALMPEPFFFYPYMKGGRYMKYWRNRLHVEYQKAMEENPEINFIINLSNYPVVRQKNVTFIFRDYFDPRLPDNFITNRIANLGGSLAQSIIFAVYLGYKKIYLAGFDYTHMPSRCLHWFEKGQGNFRDQPSYMKDFFAVAKEFVDITTITLDGSSEFLSAETYEEHTGKPALYRENNELISDNHLNVLSEWPGYKIY